jgi:hypothetical protein
MSFNDFSEVIFTVGTWLKSLPDTLVGIIIGSFFTLFGVVFTNISNLKNIRLQLQHDRQQKDREVSLTMRRDVYLVAAEGLASALSTVMRYTDLSLDNNALFNEYREKSDQIAKVHVVATVETAHHFMNFMRELSAVFMKLNIKRMELTSIRTKILANAEQIKRHRANIENFIDMMKHHNISGTMDKRLFDVLQMNINFERDASGNLDVEQAGLVESLKPLHITFFELCQAECNRLSMLLLPVVVSVRKELNQAIDETAYAQIFSGLPTIPRQELETLFGVQR